MEKESSTVSAQPQSQVIDDKELDLKRVYSHAVSFQKLLKQINLPQNLASKPDKLYRQVQMILDSLLPVKFFSVISYKGPLVKGEIVYQFSANEQLHNRMSGIFKRYLNNDNLQASQQIALLNHQIELNCDERLTWLLRGLDPENNTWLMLSVSKEYKASAELLLSLVCSRLSILAARQRYNTLLHCYQMANKELSSIRRLDRLHTLTHALKKFDGLSGDKLFFAVTKLLLEQYPDSAVHLILLENNKVETLLTTRFIAINFNALPISQLITQGQAVIVPQELQEQLHLSDNQVDALGQTEAPAVINAIAVPLKPYAFGNEKYKNAMILLESYCDNMTLEMDDVAILEYVALVISGDIERREAGVLIDKLQKIEQQVEKKNSSLQRIHQKLEQHLFEKQQQENSLFSCLLHDPLTGLANRLLMTDRLEQALLHQKRHHVKFALLFIDLDNFKKVNDQLGHHVGDAILQFSAQNISQSLRVNDLAARWGGDEFVVLIDSVNGKSDIELIIERIKKKFASPLQHKGLSLFCTCSIGINLFSSGAYSKPGEVIQDADLAMYRAKLQKGLSYHYFDETVQCDQSKKHVLRDQLSIALEQGEIIPHYQPMIRLLDNQLLGFEVMARWQHENQAIKNAIDFIPLAENSGLIAELDFSILQQALQQLQAWHKTFAGNKEIQLSVNLSGYHLGDPASMLRLTDAIAASHIDYSQLVFEFSEREVVQHDGEGVKALHQLHEQGILIGLDDFGTGFSSLNALFEYPVDYIKVDPSYTRKMLNSTRDLALIRAIRDISNDLGYQVIVEGIENKKQHSKLLEIGCEFGQGHYIARPMRHQAISKMLA